MHKFVKELLKGEKVEYKTLKDVAKLRHGKDWKKLGKGDIPVYGSGGIMTYVDQFTFDKPSVLIPRKGTITNLFYVDKPFWNVDTIYYTDINTEIMHPKFFYYMMTTYDLYSFNKSTARPSLTQEMLNPLKIPVPSFNVQNKIVEILDKFCELKTLLNTERYLRLKQYSYYREKLLTFGDDVPIKNLEEIAKLKHGKDWKKLGKGNIPVYGSGGIMTYVDQFTFDKPSVLIPRKGTITNLFYVDKPFWNVDTIYYTDINTEVMHPKFFYYVMSTYDLESFNKSTARPSLTQAMLNPLKIPVPPMEEQIRIATILEQFDNLTNSITEGLPREIELREKQYQFYRDLLLDFTDKEY